MPTRVESKLPPVIAAVVRQDTPELKLLWAAGANMSAVGEYGETALHWAAMLGNEQAVKILIEAAVNPNLKDLRENTAETLARKYNHLALAEMIRTRGQVG
jgi:ankyrin repeat protein